MEAISSSIENKSATYRISHITVDVPYRRPGNVIMHFPLEFSVHHYGAGYQAIPLCDADAQRLVGLPHVLYFEIENGRPVLQQAALKEVAEEIVRILQSEARL